MNIVLCSSDEYSVHCGTLMISILKNARLEDKFSFYIIESDISEEHKEKLRQLTAIKPFDIHFIKVDNSIFNNSSFAIDVNELPGIVVQTFYRYFVADVLKDIDRVLYLDIDILVRGSLRELYNTDLGENLIAAAPDFGMPRTVARIKEKLGLNDYFNSGVMLYDLKKCREAGIHLQLFKNHAKMYEENLITFADQCVLNYTFKNCVKMVGKKYNAMFCKRHNKSYKEAYENPVIVHFTTGRKPWNMYLQHRYANEYFRYLEYSPFEEAHELLKDYNNPWKRVMSRILKR
ncbi:MAG: glycosyltransferase family 8 protein [Muribaculaceae bacterium]|nr:glycosyltransferase family 8 protein [Muribaculaceae bacterium]